MTQYVAKLLGGVMKYFQTLAYACIAAGFYTGCFIPKGKLEDFATNDQIDRIVEYCALIPTIETNQAEGTKSNVRTPLPECIEVLDEILPLSGFTSTSLGSRTKKVVLEGLQMLISYPMAYPNDENYFAHGGGQNIIPSAFTRFATPFFEDESLELERDFINFDILVFILQRAKKIQFSNGGNGEIGSYKKLNGRLTWYSSAVAFDQSTLAAAWLHEVLHKEYEGHKPCWWDSHFKICDRKVDRPYGAQVFVPYFFALASSKIWLPTLKMRPLQSPISILDSCVAMSVNINNRPSGLFETRDATECFSWAINWLFSLPDQSLKPQYEQEKEDPQTYYSIKMLTQPNLCKEDEEENLE